MPLHLLGKKSWNVYNADNIARVKRDEAEAAAREEENEQRMQEADAERRLKLLRGESVSPLPSPPPAGQLSAPKRREKEDPGEGRDGRERKRRRIHGEDDTERDLRYAAESLAPKASGKELRLSTRGTKTSDAPLTDTKGHISLFPVEAPKSGKRRGQKHPEAEAEAKRKEQELEDQYTMRFSNAAGFKQSIGQTPWYHTLGEEPKGEEQVWKDVWGNEDPRRKEREMGRMAADDPLAMIKQGVKGVRDVERERSKWREEKAKEIRKMDEDRRERKRRREREGRYRYRSRSRSPGRSRHRHKHRSRSRDG